jgi:hypothetical protein
MERKKGKSRRSKFVKALYTTMISSTAVMHEIIEITAVVNKVLRDKYGSCQRNSSKGGYCGCKLKEDMAKNIYRKEIKRWIRVYYVDQALCQV